MRRVLCATALAGLLVAPASAEAAPRLHVLLDPSTPGVSPVVTATVAQDPGDGPPSRLTLLFPASFSLQAPPSGAAACAAAASCTRDSEIGSLQGPQVTATVHRAAAGGLFAVARGGGPLAGLVLPGSATTRPTGLHAISFEGLPATPLSPLTLRLTGGERGLVRTPSSCGRQVVEARITMHSGELAVAAAPVEITGCAAAVSRVRASARGSRVTVTWNASAAGAVRLDLQRRAGRKWRRVKSYRRSARAGRNTLRVSKRGLRPGRYRFVLNDSNEGSAAAVSRAFRVVR